MAMGINKIDNAWFREQREISERMNKEHLARFDHSFYGKLLAGDTRERDERERDVNAGASDHHASKVADLLVEAGSYPNRASALSHLLHSPQGQALLARMHKKDDPPMTSTSHTEFVQSVVKQYGIVALAKSMVQEQKAFGLDEHTFTQLATEHAQRVYPNDRPDVAFSKLYQSEENVRRACGVRSPCRSSRTLRRSRSAVSMRRMRLSTTRNPARPMRS